MLTETCPKVHVMRRRQEINYGGRFPKPQQHAAMTETPRRKRPRRRRSREINSAQRGADAPQRTICLSVSQPGRPAYEPTEVGDDDYRIVVKRPKCRVSPYPHAR